MKTSAYNANLHAILADNDTVCKAVHEMMTTRQSIKDEDARGFHLAALLDPSLPESVVASGADSFELSDLEYQLLCGAINHTSTATHLLLTRRAAPVKQISIQGVAYSAVNSVPQDSNIIFQLLNDSSTNQRAGVIGSIFQYEYLSAGDQRNKGYYLSVRAPAHR